MENRFIDATDDITDKVIARQNLERLRRQSEREVKIEPLRELNATIIVVSVCTLLMVLIFMLKS